MFDKITHLLPIELTVQNLYFHDNGSIFGISANENTFLTCGADKEIRLWSVNDKQEEKELRNENMMVKNCVNDINADNKSDHNEKKDTLDSAEFAEANTIKIELLSNQHDKQGTLDSAEVADLNTTNKETYNDAKKTENCNNNIKPNDVDVEITQIGTNDKQKTSDNTKFEVTSIGKCNQLNDTKFITSEAYNSTVSIKYIKTFSHHQKSVNCVRYSECKKYFASSADGGEVCVWNNDKKLVVKENDGDDAYELVWIGNYLAVGTATGKIYLYSISDNEKNTADKQGINSNEDVCNNTKETCHIDYKQDSMQNESLCVISQDEQTKNEDMTIKKCKVKTVNENKENTWETCNTQRSIDLSEIDVCTETLEDTNILENNKTNDFDEKSTIKNNKKLKVSKTKTIQQTLKCKHIQTIKAHSDIIQGMAYNKKYNVIATCAKDRSVKTFYLDKKLVFIDKIDTYENEKCFADENSKMLFRRPAFSFCCKYLYLPACIDIDGNFCVFVLHYPFRSIDFYGKIGSFDSPATKILSSQDCTIIMCKKSIYYIENNAVLFSVKNTSFFPMTDCCYMDNLFCFTSLDGFIYTLRLRKDKKFVNNDVLRIV